MTPMDTKALDPKASAYKIVEAIEADCHKQKLFLGTVNAKEVIRNHVAEAIAALSRVQEPVAVKPLEWRRGYRDETVVIIQADTLGGIYQIREIAGTFTLDTPSYSEVFPSLEAAKDAAQADYEQRILSALATPPAPQGDAAQPGADETAWLIELRGNVPSWWSLDPDEEPGWLRDANKALRFARREDAENYINDMCWNDAFATEHMWPASPAASQAREEGK